MVGVQFVRLCRTHGRARSRPAGVCVRLVRVSLPGHGRLSLDHHAGADLRAKARLFPQRLRFWRQQRLDRFQRHRRFQRAERRDPRDAVFDYGADAGARFVVGKAIVSSKYGKALIAVRDAESRVRFLGYRVENYKLFVWVVSAVIAGIAGALYVPQVGIINPSEFDPGNSIEAVIWVAVGGRGTLVGAALGAVIVNFAKTYFTGALPEYWLFALGALFILTTLFLPKGILGLLMSRREKKSLPPATLSPVAPQAGGAE